MDPNSFRLLMGVGSGNVLPPIGEAYEGGYVAGYISHTADGSPTHILIVSPESTGETTSLSWKTSSTSTSGATSVFDGYANTQAMVAAGIADHPAANFCVGLSIGGYSDWYLPARLELEIAYFNLKPTTDNNSTSVGVNDYSVPKRISNYTVSNPAQTSVALFQSSGGQDFYPGISTVIAANEFYWSSNETSATNAPSAAMGNGGTVNTGKGSSLRVRAFRRVAR
jgi:hypothetical protein